MRAWRSERDPESHGTPRSVCSLRREHKYLLTSDFDSWNLKFFRITQKGKGDKKVKLPSLIKYWNKEWRKEKILSIICHGGGDQEHIKFIQKNLNAENQVKIDCLFFWKLKRYTFDLFTSQHYISYKGKVWIVRSQKTKSKRIVENILCGDRRDGSALKVLAVLPEGQRSVPSIHSGWLTTSQIPAPGNLPPSLLWLCGHLHTCDVDTQTQIHKTIKVGLWVSQEGV